MKTLRPIGYHHNGFVVTHALGHMTILHITANTESKSAQQIK